MNNGILGGPRRESDQLGVPPYRPFRDRPSGVWIQRVVDVIRETGEPEKVGGLFHGKIDRAAKFRKLRAVEVDRRKRPDGDMAPCPRCGCTDKFLNGHLAWFPDLQFCAVIGHCCASQEALSDAEREWRVRDKLQRQESVLLDELPRLSEKSRRLTKLRSPAGEALRVYRQFRREAKPIHSHLREIKVRFGGHLRLTEVLSSAEEQEESETEYIGPAGFRGRGRGWVETRDIELGIVEGLTAVEKNFNPISQIDTVARILDTWDGGRPTEEQAVDMIIEMDERHRTAAVAILKALDDGYDKVARKLVNFWTFFSEENIELLNSYGTHPESPFHFEARHASDGKRRLIVFKQGLSECRLSFQETHATFESTNK